MRPGKVAREQFPHLEGGILGTDPSAPTSDVEGPTNRADPNAGAVACVPDATGTDIEIVQWATNEELLSPSVSVTLGSAPQPGSRLVAWHTVRDTGRTPGIPSGWTTHPDGVVYASGTTGDPGVMGHKVAGIGESATITASIAEGGARHRLVVVEIARADTLVGNDSLTDQNGTNIELEITPSGSADTIIIGGFVIASGDGGTTQSVTPDANSTELVDEEIQTTLHPLTWVAYRIVNNPSGAYAVGGTISVTNKDWAGEALAFAIDGAGVIAVEAPLTIDGSDTSYEYVRDRTAGAWFWRIDLGTAYALASIDARLGVENAGAQTITVRGANEADFSDASTLTTISVTATGSMAAQDVTGSWTPGTAYRFYELLLGTSDDVDVYEVSLFDPPAGGGVSDHPDLTGRDEADQHPAESISYDNDYSGLTAETVQDAIDELASTPAVSALASLTDVDVSGVSDGDFLSYDDADDTWKPTGAPSGTIPSGTDPGDILVWDGSAWTAEAAPSAGGFTAYDTLISSMSGLVHRWKFEESSGNFADSVGSLTLTASGSITYGVPGGPISGANGSITYGASARGLSSGLGNIPVGSAARTFVMIFRGFDNGSTSDQALYSYGAASTRQWFTQLVTNISTLRLAPFGDDLDFTNQPVASETWHMVASVYDGQRIITQFRDGFSGSRRLGAQLNTSSGGNFSIGQDAAGGRQAGAITVDDLAVFDRALSPYEIQLLFAAMAGQLP